MLSKLGLLDGGRACHGASFDLEIVDVGSRLSGLSRLVACRLCVHLQNRKYALPLKYARCKVYIYTARPTRFVVGLN